MWHVKIFTFFFHFFPQENETNTFYIHMFSYNRSLTALSEIKHSEKCIIDFKNESTNHK